MAKPSHGLVWLRLDGKSDLKMQMLPSHNLSVSQSDGKSISFSERIQVRSKLCTLMLISDERVINNQKSLIYSL